MISYYLSENRLATTPGQQSAVISNAGTIGEDELIDLITADGSGVSKAATKAVLQRLAPAMLTMLKTGNTINLGIFNARVSIEGTFENQFDGFDATRHRLKVNIMPGIELMEGIKDAGVQKVEPVKSLPVIDQWNDWVSKTSDSIATQNGHGQLIGQRLKFDPTKADEGIYFIKLDNNAETKVQQVEKIMPKEVLFLVPSLPSGAYRLEIRCRVQGGMELRIGALPEPITVS